MHSHRGRPTGTRAWWQYPKRASSTGMAHVPAQDVMPPVRQVLLLRKRARNEAEQPELGGLGDQPRWSRQAVAEWHRTGALLAPQMSPPGCRDESNSQSAPDFLKPAAERRQWRRGSRAKLASLLCAAGSARIQRPRSFVSTPGTREERDTANSEQIGPTPTRQARQSLLSRRW